MHEAVWIICLGAYTVSEILKYFLLKALTQERIVTQNIGVIWDSLIVSKLVCSFSQKKNVVNDDVLWKVNWRHGEVFLVVTLINWQKQENECQENEKSNNFKLIRGSEEFREKTSHETNCQTVCLAELFL